MELILAAAGIGKSGSSEELENLVDSSERLKVVRALAIRYRFLHWELEFADLFNKNGGFDLVIGNPPWIKLEWQETGVLGDHEPAFVVKKISASDAAKLRGRIQLKSMKYYLNTLEHSRKALPRKGF